MILRKQLHSMLEYLVFLICIFYFSFFYTLLLFFIVFCIKSCLSFSFFNLYILFFIFLHSFIISYCFLKTIMHFIYCWFMQKIGFNSFYMLITFYCTLQTTKKFWNRFIQLFVSGIRIRNGHCCRECAIYSIRI